MSGADAPAQSWPIGAGEDKQPAMPRGSATDSQTPPYWTLDTITAEWVQRQRDGTEIRRAPIRHKHEQA